MSYTPYPHRGPETRRTLTIGDLLALGATLNTPVYIDSFSTGDIIPIDPGDVKLIDGVVEITIYV